MRRWIAALVMVPALALAAGVPQRLAYQGRLLDAGSPVNGALSVSFTILDAATGGNALWTETQNVGFSNGFYAVYLGDATPIPSAIFDGTERFLEIAIAGKPLTPRQRIDSVAYATAAQNVLGGTVDATSINSSSGVSVGNNPVIDSTGHLTGNAAYSAGAGLQLSGNAFSLNSTGCSNGQALSWSGSAWVCADIGQKYSAGSGLLLNGSAFSLNNTGCSSGQAMSWNGSAWACASVGQAYTAGPGLSLAGNAFSLNSSACSSGQALSWNGSALGCTSVGQSYTAGAGLLLSGSTLSIDPTFAGFIQNQTAAPQAGGFSLAGNGSLGGNLNVSGTSFVSGNSTVGKLIINSPFPTNLLTVDNGNAGPVDQGITIQGASATFGDLGLRINNKGLGGVEWYLDSTANGSGYGGGNLAFISGVSSPPVLLLNAATGVSVGTPTHPVNLNVSGTANLNGGVSTPTVNAQNLFASARMIATGSVAPALIAQYTGSGAGAALQLNNGNILVSGVNPMAFTVTVSASNLVDAVDVRLSSPLFDADPQALIFVTQQTTSVNPHAVSVTWTGSGWFLHSAVPFALGEVFNIMVISTH